MSADTDAVHQIVDSSTVVHNVERNEVICGLSRNYSNFVWVAELALSGFYVLVCKCIHFLEENNNYWKKINFGPTFCLLFVKYIVEHLSVLIKLSVQLVSVGFKAFVGQQLFKKSINKQRIAQ